MVSKSLQLTTMYLRALIIEFESSLKYFPIPNGFIQNRFSLKWITWVMENIFIMFYSISINCILKGKIQPLRSIRQRDPLLLYVFILCIEYLGKGMVK